MAGLLGKCESRQGLQVETGGVAKRWRALARLPEKNGRLGLMGFETIDLKCLLSDTPESHTQELSGIPIFRHT